MTGATAASSRGVTGWSQVRCRHGGSGNAGDDNCVASVTKTAKLQPRLLLPLLPLLVHL